MWAEQLTILSDWANWEICLKVSEVATPPVQGMKKIKFRTNCPKQNPFEKRFGFAMKSPDEFEQRT